MVFVVAASLLIMTLLPPSLPKLHCANGVCDEARLVASAMTLPVAPIHIAIVQWSHTLRMQNALLLARKQVLDQRMSATRAIYWGHHVLMQTCNPGTCNSKSSMLHHGGQQVASHGGDAPGKASRAINNCSTPAQLEALESEHCALKLDALTQRGLTENVSCYTSFDMARSVPSLGSIKNVFERRGPHATNLNVGAYRWCWHTCDGAYITWYAREEARLRHYSYFWVLEWDVVWTGVLPTLLQSWHVDRATAHDTSERGGGAPAGVGGASVRGAADALRTSQAKNLGFVVDGLVMSVTEKRELVRASANIRKTVERDPRFRELFLRSSGNANVEPGDLRASEDLLCPHPTNVARRWQHSMKRNYSAVPEAANCVTQLSRFSQRLMREVARFATEARHGMFCEMRAPTVCRRNDWCSVRSFFDEPHQPYLFTNRTTWEASWGTAKFTLADLQTPTADGPTTILDKNVLYHAYKWPRPDPKGDGSHLHGSGLYDDLVGLPMASPRDGAGQEIA